MFRTSLRNTVLDVMLARGWEETKGELDWDIFWADVRWIRDNIERVKLHDFQRVNHFANQYELTRKDCLVKNVKRVVRMIERGDTESLYGYRGPGATRRHHHGGGGGGGGGGSAAGGSAAGGGAPGGGPGSSSYIVEYDPFLDASKYNFLPATFTLPSEYSLFVEHFKKIGGVWIMKPVAGSLGKGIFLVSKLSQVSGWRPSSKWSDRDRERERERDPKEPAAGLPYIVQNYLSEPYLVGGKKFDLRIYCLVTSYQPLTCYVYRSGFARFTFQRYSMDTANMEDRAMHLTNVSIQKKSDSYDQEQGCKWPLSSLRTYLTAKHGRGDVNDCFGKIQSIIIHSLLAVQNVMIQDSHCFELYGYDVLLDSDLHPWLIEVNSSPALTATTAMDYILKTALMEDTLNIVDIESRLMRNPDGSSAGGPPSASSARGRGGGGGGPEDPPHMRVGGFDLTMWKNSLIRHPDSSYLSFLGCVNDRVVQLRRLQARVAKAERASSSTAAGSDDSSSWDGSAAAAAPTRKRRGSARRKR